MKSLFIAGTDTGVGKTVITGLLARFLLDEGYKVATQKWVQTGHSNDVDIHLRLMGKKKPDYAKYLDLALPYSFGLPSSPHLAARTDGRKIRVGKIKNSLNHLSEDFDYVLIEGTGGLLVPFDYKNLLIDIVKELDLTVLLVAGNRIGTINHTLLSIEALRARHIKFLGVIFNATSGRADSRILKDNVETVKRLTGVRVLGNIPYLKK